MQSNLAGLSKRWRALTNNFYAKPQIITIRIMKPSATSNKAYTSFKQTADRIAVMQRFILKIWLKNLSFLQSNLNNDVNTTINEQSLSSLPCNEFLMTVSGIWMDILKRNCVVKSPDPKWSSNIVRILYTPFGDNILN